MVNIISIHTSAGKDFFVISGLHGKIDAANVRVVRVTVKDQKYPASPSAAFIKFDDRDSSNIYLIKASSRSESHIPCFIIFIPRFLAGQQHFRVQH